MQIQTLQFVKKTPPHWTLGTVRTPGEPAYKVLSDWSRADYWGMIRSRMSSFRMSYSVEPGLYAVGDPSMESDVFVSANYKLSFDILRRELKGMNAWILVLDTKSINVWCAAGKGTFGTDELANRIALTKLDSLVTHRRIILPQLGAVGVNAAEILKRTGFRVSFGPVEARDIPAYIQAGYKKTVAMRTMEFPMMARLILTPMEINPAIKKFSWFAAGFLLFFGLEPQGILFKNAFFGGFPFLVMLLSAIVSGAFLMPVLLPFIPSRSFAIKGWIMGLAVQLVLVHGFGLLDQHNLLLLIAAYLFFPTLSSYIALQFTGTTTFTGMTGVQKELKIGIPVYIGAATLSVAVLIAFKLKEWGLV